MTDTTAMAEQRRARLPHTAAFLHSRPRNPYRVPRPAVISFSGGRTSAYMLKKIVNAYGGHLPSDVAVVFSNTGMERPETLDFVDVCARAWAVRIHWVEYFWDAPHRTRVVDHATASRNGEPYAALIDRKGFVPSQGLRYCTGFLKRDRIESYARHWLGLRRWHSVIGLRADEPRRVWRMRAMNCGSRTGAHAVLPLADAGVRQADVIEWWEAAALRSRHPILCGELHALHAQGPRQAHPPHPRGSLALPTGGSSKKPRSPTEPARTAAPATA